MGSRTAVNAQNDSEWAQVDSTEAFFRNLIKSRPTKPVVRNPG
jgi:hypothetical protein